MVSAPIIDDVPSVGDDVVAPLSISPPEPSLLPESSGPMDVRSIALAVLATLAVVLALQWARELLIPLTMGILISYALTPIVTRLAKWKIPRPVGAAVVLLAIVSSLGYLSSYLGSDIASLMEELPQAAEKVSRSLEKIHGGGGDTLEKMQKAATAIEKAATGPAASTPSGRKTEEVAVVQPIKPAVDIRAFLLAGSKNALSLVWQAVLVLFLVYFLLASGNLFKRKLVKITGTTLSEKRVTVEIINEIDAQIERFLLVQLVTNALVGVAIWLSFWALGLHNAGAWGFASAVLHTIPYVGPAMVTGGVALVGFLQFGTVSQVVLLAATSTGIMTVVGLLIVPWASSRAARMNAGAVFIGLLFFGWIWGVWGLLLGTPIMMIVKAVCDRVERLKFVGELLGT